MSIFSVPEEVAWELSDEALFERNYEQSPHQLCCRACGEEGFEWKQTPHGWRLVYGHSWEAKLRGKLHACEP
jgi:hypothetical protein